MTARAGSEEVLEKLHKALALPWATKDFETIKEDLREGRLQAFWNDEGIILTEICVSPRRKFLNVFLAAGKLRALKELKPKVVQFAREHGIEQAQAIFRPEWAPWLKRNGWVKWSEIWHLPKENWD